MTTLVRSLGESKKGQWICCRSWDLSGLGGDRDSQPLSKPDRSGPNSGYPP